MPSRSRRDRQDRRRSTEDEPPDRPTGEPAGFGRFGSAMVREVMSAAFVRRRLDEALHAVLESSELPPELAAEVTEASVTEARLVSGDDRERRFGVTVRLELEADVGPRLLALGVDARIEVSLLVRVRAFRPATVGFDIDPVTPDDVWFHTRARSDWLPFPLLAGGPSGLSRPAQRTFERAVPTLCQTVNAALEAAVEHRRIDLLDRLSRYGARSAPDRNRTGPRRPRAGRPMSFAELGETLLGRGIDHRVVGTAVTAALQQPLAVALDEPTPVRGTVETRVLDVVALSGEPDERRFRLRLVSDVDVLVGEGERAAVVTATVRADVPLRVVTRVRPATLVATFEPVSRLSVRRARRAMRGWMVPIPVPNRTLSRVRRRVVEEVDRRLAGTAIRVVAAELVDSVLGPDGGGSFGVRVESADGQSWPTAKPSSTSRLE